MVRASFETLDLGSAKPISIPMETIDVEITVNQLFADYAKAFINEATRKNPLMMDRLKLTTGEVESYITYLLQQRVNMVKMDCPDYRKLKVLYIPIWVQYMLTMIGKVVMRERGITLMPTINAETITLSEAIAISEKIGSLVDDLNIVQDAMPRSIEGDKDVMSTALIDGYVRGLDKVTHVSSTYVTAFLGMKLQEESAFKILYRIQYDDVEFIRSAITGHKGLF